MKDRISIEVNDGIADVRFVRSKKMNALDAAMFDAITAAGEQLRSDNSIRVVVLSGEGRAFCAGLDMSNFSAAADAAAADAAAADAAAADAAAADAAAADAASNGDTDNATQATLETRTHGIANKFQNAAWMWRELPVPVIAAVHGVAFGGGFQVALGADMRYAAPGTRMSVMEIKWGLVPDMAGTALMRHLAGDDIVRELTYTGRIFDAQEAHRIGFVTAIVDDPLAHAMDVAASIATRNPDAIRADKQLLNESLHLDPLEAMLLESRLQDTVMGQPNQIEAVMAELEGRAANYR